MLQMINQKYPAPNPATRNLYVSLLFGLFIGLFLLFFQPFGIHFSTDNNKVFEIFFFGIITASVLAIFLFVLPFLLPNVFSDKHWKVKHQIAFYFIALFAIATLNGIYTNYINSLPFSWSNYWWIINRTFVLGGIPIAFIVLIDYYRKDKINTKYASEILQKKREFTHDSEAIFHRISTDLKNEMIAFEENDFHYAMAFGNYIDLYISEKSILKTKTFRITLSSFEAQLKTTNLLRCHRSYLVNLNKVENISGNAQGLKLQLKNLQEIVPVSRKYIPIIKKSLLHQRTLQE